MQPILKFTDQVEVKGDTITAILSTESVDRDGDVVRLDGWDLDNFRKSPRLMSCHDYGDLRKQIGEWRNVRVDQRLKALVGEPHYYTDQGNAEADWAYYLATQGQATYSVGFAPLESEPRKAGGLVYSRQEMLECSQVPIPAQPDSRQLMLKALKALQKSPPQPVQKAGKPISGANMGHLHTALQSLHTVHDANCTAADCPLDDDGSATERDKGRRKAKAPLCPFCDPKSAVDSDPEDCTCDGDCGEDDCPEAAPAKSKRTQPEPEGKVYDLDAGLAVMLKDVEF